MPIISRFFTKDSESVPILQIFFRMLLSERYIYLEMEIGIPFLSNECATPILLETGRVPAHVGIHESTVD